MRWTLWASLVGLVCQAVVATGTAWAAGTWDDSFPSEAVATYLDSDQQRLLVVASGPATAERDAATAAVVSALRKVVPARTVLTAESLGVLDAADDVTIAKKANHLPVTAIVVVRVFPTGDGQATAVVTFLNKAGEPLRALSANKGTPVVAGTGDGSASPGEGVSTKAADAVEKVRVAPSETADAESEYARKRIGFRNIIGLNAYGGVVQTWTDPYLGSPMNILSIEEFYRTMGHEDLAKSVQTRANWRLGLGLGGVGAVVGSTVFLVQALTFDGGCGKYDFGTAAYKSCDRKESDTVYSKLKWSGASLGLGVVLIVATNLINPNPVSTGESFRLADEYNRKLRASLGLPPLSSKAPVRKNWFANVSSPLPGATGIEFGAQF